MNEISLVVLDGLVRQVIHRSGKDKACIEPYAQLS